MSFLASPKRTRPVSALYTATPSAMLEATHMLAYRTFSMPKTAPVRAAQVRPLSTGRRMVSGPTWFRACSRASSRA